MCCHTFPGTLHPFPLQPCIQPSVALPAPGLPSAHFPVTLLVYSPQLLPGWLPPPTSCISLSAIAPGRQGVIPLVYLSRPCICLSPNPMAAHSLLLSPSPLPREAAAASYAMTAWSQPHGRAGGSCTLAVLPTTTKGCPPPGVLATLWCPSSTPDTRPLCQTSPAIVPSCVPLLGGGLSGSSLPKCSLVCLGLNVSPSPTPIHTQLSQEAPRAPLFLPSAPKSLQGGGFCRVPCVITYCFSASLPIKEDL